MSKGKWWGIGLLLLIVLSLTGGYIFYANTGGNALSRVVWYYFIRDLPDKKYSWRDFTERGVDQGISGFYAYGDSESLTSGRLRKSSFLFLLSSFFIQL